MYLVKEVIDREQWETFLLSEPWTLFTQSSAYGDFYRSLGESAWIFGVYEGEKLVGGALVVSTHAKRGNFLFVPYGPVCTKGHEGIIPILLQHIKAFGKKSGYVFLRISPYEESSPQGTAFWKELGAKPAPMHVLAETTWLLDIRPSVDELLAHMNKNHRNLIRRLEKEGVRVEIRTDDEAIALFNTLHDVTALRHKFTRFSATYITKEFQAMRSVEGASVLLGYLPDGTLDAAAIMMKYGTMAAYRHGASLGKDKRLPVSYLVQWAAIQEAKRLGGIWYNFWGIAPEGASSSHPFHGITHFKKGFGGFLKELEHCQDIPLSPWYALNWLIETFRRFRRGFA